MRPRVFPAEDTGRPTRPRWRPSYFNEAAGIPRGRRCCRRCGGTAGWYFNEAAGIPRGRRTATIRATDRGETSMRPRVFPAEDLGMSELPWGMEALQ